MKSVRIQPLHQNLYSRVCGQWVWLPQTQWKLQCRAGHLRACNWQTGEQHTLSWQTSHFIDRFEVVLDLQRGWVRVCVHEPKSRVHIICKQFQGQPIWFLDRFCNLDGRQELQVSYNDTPCLMPLKQPFGLSSLFIEKPYKRNLAHTLEIWFGTNKQQDWSDVLRRGNPFELAHILVQASRWLPEQVWNDRAQEIIELDNPYGLDWLSCWYHHCMHSLQGMVFVKVEGAKPLESLVALAQLAQYFIRRWVDDTPQGFVIDTQASSKALSGRIIGYKSFHSPVCINAYWCKSKIRMVEITSEQDTKFSISFKPKVKACRLTEHKISRVIALESASLELELKAGADYRIDKFIF